MKKKIILGVAILTLMSGCGKTIPTLENGQNAVVTFEDGSKISIDELYNNLKNSQATSILVDMIDKKILEEKYKDQLEEAETYAKNYIESLKNYYTDENGKYDETKLLNAVNQYGYNNLDDFKESVRLNYLRNKSIDEYAESLVTDKEIEKYYNDEVHGDREVYHIQITPDVKDSMTDDEKKAKEEEAENKAKSIIASLKKGENFEELAKQNSNDEASKESGGSLGFMNKGSYGSEEFDKELYSLKIGEYSSVPIKTTNGYEILYIKSEQEKPALDDKKEEIKQTLGKEKLDNDATLQVTAITELRKSKGVDIIDSEINKNYQNLINNLMSQARASNTSSTN